MPGVVPPSAEPLERAFIRREIDELEEEKDETASLGGPITLMAMGGGTMAFSLMFAAWGSFERDYQQSLSSVEGGSSESNAGNAMIAVGLTGAVIGAGLLIGGGAWLGPQIRKRRALNDKIDLLEVRLEGMTTSLVPLVNKSGGGLNLRVVF